MSDSYHPSLYSYLKDTENYNFYEFLIIHRNVVVNSPPFNDDLILINGTLGEITDIVNKFYTTQGTSSQDLDSTINPSSSASEGDEANIIEDLDTSDHDELSNQDNLVNLEPLRNDSSSQDDLNNMNNLEPPSSHDDLIHLESLNQDNDSYQVQFIIEKEIMINIILVLVE
ncbi:hypothetical protein C2G38_2227802 [Gigaspora rosea]|uniref:Uncharacterized protein n=1 Tax=Gigaspora rosea TaxID=44941 RepID=A0A397U4W0_9GLOM|nr:hypothetical protein C2G38_2227802 [Gigaspora rosea]